MVTSPESGVDVSPDEQGESRHETSPPADEGVAVGTADEHRDPHEDSGPALTVAAVARRLGVAPATLRTWDRRYDLGPSEHMAGSHRRYSSSDVARLLVMRRLTLEGVAPSEAARTALAAPQGSAPQLHVPSAAEVMDAYASAEPMAPDPAGLAAAAASFDNAAVRWMLTRVHPGDVLAWWTDLVEPALGVIGVRGAAVRPGEGAACALTAAAFAELRSRAVAATARLDSRSAGVATVLLIPTGAADELHVHVLATALQAGGVLARVLSWSRAAEIRDAVDELAPIAVIIDLAAADAAADRLGTVLDEVRAAQPMSMIFVHQEGSAPLDVPAQADVHRVRTMTGALHEVLAVV